MNTTHTPAPIITEGYFTFRNTYFHIVQIRTINNGAWTHCAEVKRANGKVTYYANLILDEAGKVILANVIF